MISPWKAWREQPQMASILSNVSWLSAGRVVRLSIALGVNVWVARYLGPRDFGLLSYALSVVGLLAPTAYLGLNNVVVREVVKRPADSASVLGTSMALQGLGGLLIFGLANAAALVLSPTDPLAGTLVFAASAGSCFLSANVFELWFRARMANRLATLAQLAAFVVTAAVRVALVLSQASVLAFAWVTSLEMLLTAIALGVAYTRSGMRTGPWRVSLADARRLMRDAWPLIFSGLVTMVYMRVDQLMLADLVGSEAVGIYAVAVRLSEAWIFLPTAVATATLPSIVEAHKQDEQTFYARLQRLYGVMALVGYGVAVPTTLVAFPLVKLLYGPAYAEAAPMLIVLTWASLFVNLGMARTSFLTAMNWTRAHFATVFLGAIANVALNLLWIPRYGGMGAAAASLVAYWLATHGACLLYRPLWRTGRMLTRALLRPSL